MSKLKKIIDLHLQEQRNLNKEFQLTVRAFVSRLIGSIVYKSNQEDIRRNIATSGIAWVESINSDPAMSREVEIEILARKQANSHLKERSDFITTLLWLMSFVGLGSALSFTNTNNDLFPAIVASIALIFAFLGATEKVNSLNSIMENEYIISLLEMCNKSTNRHPLKRTS
ncbi:hypothetical protein [Microbulbifer sp. THAF38]|uniref:hypothetical protein n=1 Tax=Microbulbifer sp. THAF38 TaxID=2587856 RepID=UPI001267E7A2|nr:hypothetical protein [Microbulbifer sp. THAF38]QFT53087.1 hypothetical protein FIU95_00635 [Microbulbifer sp. THAF38]